MRKNFTILPSTRIVYNPKIVTATNLPQEKIEELKEPVKLIKEAQNYSELAKLSADAFNSSFFSIGDVLLKYKNS
jgi:hypothetical protein